MNTFHSLPRAFALLPLLGLAACQSTGMSAMAPASGPAGGALAFVAVQGPDAATAAKFQTILGAEAKRRGYSVGSGMQNTGMQNTGMQVKTFLDSYPTPDGKTGFAWVMDASGDGRARHARVKGTAMLGTANTTNPWAAFDEAAMQQVARMGLDDLTRQMQGASAQPTPSDE